MRAVLATLVLAACPLAQAPDRGPPSTAERLVERALSDDRAHAILAELLAAAPKRLSGTDGMAAARRWARTKMLSLGLENVRFEEVTVPLWVRGDVARLVARGAGGETAYPITALGGSVGTPAGGLRAGVVVVRSFEELHARAADARGKMVLFNRPMPRALRNTFVAYGDAVPQRGSGAVEAAKVGAVAAIVRSLTTAIDDHPHTGSMRYAEDAPRVPAVAISTRGADDLAARVAAGEEVELHLELDCRDGGEVPCANVVGEIVGRERPEEIVLIGGHLDAWDTGDGAHDDGAGCVHCLEAARLLLACGVPLARTLRIVLFTNEEHGLRGGRGYAERHAAALPEHVAALETDRGGFEPKGFTTTLDATRRQELSARLRYLSETGMGAILPGGGGADIAPLRTAGVPLFGLLVADHRYFDYHHSALDTLAAVDDRELALGGAAVAALVAVLADPAQWTR